jgi:ABC-type antimicrobial peptide transport system permease subunit
MVSGIGVIDWLTTPWLVMAIVLPVALLLTAISALIPARAATRASMARMRRD